MAQSKFTGLSFGSDITKLIKKYKIPWAVGYMMHTLLSSMNTKRRVTWKSIKTLAKEMSVSEKTTKRTLKWLTDNHLISTKQVRKKDGSFSHSEKRFIFNPGVGFTAFTVGSNTVGPVSPITVGPLSRDGSQTPKCNNNSITDNRVKEMYQEKQQQRAAVDPEKIFSEEKKQPQIEERKKRENFVLSEFEKHGHWNPKKLLEDCGLERMERQLEYLPYRTDVRDPAAYLDRAVRSNFSMPKEIENYTPSGKIMERIEL